MEFTSQVNGFEELNGIIKQYSSFLQKPTKFYKRAGVLMLKDVKDHFDKEEGEDSKWKISKRAKAEGGKTLQDSRRLLQSIDMAVHTKEVEVGTNVQYAAIHNFGGTVKTKFSKFKMPERKFMWISDKAAQSILDEFIVQLAEVG